MSYNYSVQLKEESDIDFKTVLALIFPDGVVTDNGDGTFTIAVSDGGGGGITQVTSVTLSSGNWNLVSGLYEYDYANTNITADSIVDIIPENADIDTVIAAQILPKTLSSSGSVKLYARIAPSADITVTVNISTKS